MRKVLMGLALLAIAPMARAQFTTPTVGNQYLGPNDAPCIPYAIGQSTGTSQIDILSSGPAWINWVALGTATVDASHYLTLLDTGSVNNTGLYPVVPKLYFGSTTQNTIISFEPPVRLANGLTAQLNNAADFSVVCVRKATQQTP